MATRNLATKATEEVRVAQIMAADVKTCRPDDTLAKAAEIMWDADCGAVPVVGDGGRLVGMITDRDVCMAGYISGCSLSALEVSGAMSRNVHSCRPDDSLDAAEKVMRANRIRRLPVVDAEEHVLGILSLSDIALGFTRDRAAGEHRIKGEAFAETVAAICRPRKSPPRPAA